MNHHQETVVDAAVRLSPPAAVMGATFLNMTVADWIQWLTLLYLILLVSHKLWTTWREFKEYWFSDKSKKAKNVGSQS